MAFPVIKVNSATGSDSAASGAGPNDGTTGGSTLTGSSASTSGDGLTVTLDGSPDLSNVLTDGSHVIYLADATAGNRNFGKITAKDDGADTVTVADAFGTTLSGLSWAIGGKRASIGSTSTKKLAENNSSNGDAMPGWTIEMESGHTETIGDIYNIRRSGNVTDGPIILRGEFGAASLPIVTSSINDTAIRILGSQTQLRDFELRNTNATKNFSRGVRVDGASGNAIVVERIKINHATNTFWQGMTIQSVYDVTVRACEVAYCTSVGITGNLIWILRLFNCYIHDCTSHGMSLADGTGVFSHGNIFSLNGGDGANCTATSTFGGVPGAKVFFTNCTFDNNVSDGLEFTGAGTSMAGTTVRNNIFSNNGGYGVKFSNGSHTAEWLTAMAIDVDSNNTYNNTSGPYLPTGYGTNGSTGDPSYTNAAGADYSIGAAIKATGYPTEHIGTWSSTRSYVDPGAAQREEPEAGQQRTFIY